MLLTMGLIPFRKLSLNTGGYLDPGSFTKAAGRVPAAWEHWRDNSEAFTHEASYMVGSDGLMIWHQLDTTKRHEALLARAIYDGARLYYSYGVAATPEASKRTYAILDANAELVPAAVNILALRPHRGLSLGHIAYVRKPAIWQDPIMLIG